MTTAGVSDSISLHGDLLLEPISMHKFPSVNSFSEIKNIDLQQLKNVDSAGIAYLVQIKHHFQGIVITGASQKVLTLADLYGVSFLFQE